MIRALLRMVQKDFKLLQRDPKTFVLVFLTPIFIMAILGNVFNEPTGVNAVDSFKIGLCDMDMSPLVNLTSEGFVPEMMGEDCDEGTNILVRQGELRGLIVIPENFTSDISEGYGSTLILHLDNSKSIAAATIETVMRAYVQERSEELGSEFISQAWVNIRELNENLKIVTRELLVVRNTAEEMQEEVDSLTLLLDDMDFSGFDSKLQENKDRFDRRLEGFKVKLERSREDISNLQENVTMLTGADVRYDRLRTISNDYCVFNVTLFENTTCFGNRTCSVGYNACNELSSSVDVLEGSSKDLQERVLGISTSLEDVDRSISVLIDETESMQKSSDAAFETRLRQLEEERQSALLELHEMTTDLSDFLEQLIEFQEDLNKTTQVLDRYTSIDPENIVAPISLEEHLVFNATKKITFMTPGLIGVIMMFIVLFLSSSSIVQEKNGGTMIRTFLAPLHLFVFVLEKVIVSMILAFLQAGLLILVAFVFGVSVSITVDLMIVLLSLAFILVSLGVFIGSVSNNENTSLLTSLVIGIPMLFLSGVFFPFEIMPSYMRTISWNLPLSMVIRNLEKAMIYHVGINLNEIGILIGLGVVFLVLATFFVRRGLER